MLCEEVANWLNEWRENVLCRCWIRPMSTKSAFTIRSTRKMFHPFSIVGATPHASPYEIAASYVWSIPLQLFELQSCLYFAIPLCQE